MRIRILVILFLLVGMAGHMAAQEVLNGLSVNPVIIEKYQSVKNQAPDHYGPVNGGLDTIPVLLPFIDDFSSLAVFPSGKWWIDKDAFENDDYPVYPVNIGAITLDAINDSGRMYPDATPGPATFIADHLTSRYVRLDSVFAPAPKALTPQDSVYLSFYYQPQGRGRAPQNNDSLILQFLLKPAYDSLIPGGGIVRVPDKWKRIWFSNGMPLDTFYVKNNKWFVRVMIPIIDDAYFSKKFRFRFYNYVSLASASEPSWQSNTDQWNLDQIYLNYGRNHYDSVFPELRFIQRPTTLLKKYSALPYPQYCDNPTNELRDSLDVLMSNRDITPKMATYNYIITQPGSGFSKTYSGGNYNIQPYQVSPYVTYPRFAHPEMPFLLPVGDADSAEFHVQHVLKEAVAGSNMGDTVVNVLKLYNYFAYDDGTAEASYGLTPAGAKLAYSFKLNKSPDTLRAVRIYFNQTLSPADERQFFLCVWNDNAGKPGDTIYSQFVYPRYADSLNKFVTYHLSPPIAVTGTFYVGWIQTTGDNLSVGFDRYNNSQKSIFYNTGGTWINSAFSGSLLIHPVLGKPIPLGINNKDKSTFDLTLFPNPCFSSSLHLDIPDQPNTENADISIYDITGRIQWQGKAAKTVDVSMLENGIYLLEFKEKGGQRLAMTRFIISR